MPSCVSLAIVKSASPNNNNVLSIRNSFLFRNNTAHVSTCNNMGLALGGLIVSFCIAILTSEEFCNEHLRKTHETGGIITIKGII